MTCKRIRLQPVGGSLGAEIAGVDLQNLDEPTFEEIHRALLEYQVIFLRQSELDDQTQMSLAYRFGQPSVFPVMQLLGESGPTFQVIEDGPQSPNAADHWHTDVTWIAQPPKIALLRASIVPKSGGDTMWGSMTAAYEALSPKMQEILAGLEVIHDNESFIRGMSSKIEDAETADNLARQLRENYPPVTHPLVRTHPETGRRALLYGGYFMRGIVGMHDQESTLLLDFLARHVDQPRFHCRWRWQPGDLAIWDERATIHQVVNDHFPQVRRVHRCVIDGDRPYLSS